MSQHTTRQTNTGHSPTTTRTEQSGESDDEDAARHDDVLCPADSAQRPDISLVIPTMNEETGVAECIDRAADAFRELGVRGEILVSDSSDDRTPKVARERGAIVVRPRKRGYGNAYLHAFDRVRADLVAMGDGDTTYDFRELPSLVERLHETGADIVLGSRLAGEIRPGAMPFLHRTVGNPMLTKFLNVFYGAGVTDAHSGMRVFERAVVEELTFTSEGMEFASEMIMRASARGMTVEEVPITYHEREGEANLDTFRDGWRHVKFMLIHAPGRLFSLPSVALLTVGVTAMLLAVLGDGGPVARSHAAVVGALLTVLGYQVAVLGFVATLVAEPILTQRDRVTSAVQATFSLERGLALGALVLLTGASALLYLVATWATTGTPPGVAQSAAAAATVTVGLQMVFHAFFLSMLGRTGPAPLVPVAAEGGEAGALSLTEEAD